MDLPHKLREESLSFRSEYYQEIFTVSENHVAVTLVTTCQCQSTLLTCSRQKFMCLNIPYMQCVQASKYRNAYCFILNYFPLCYNTTF